MPSDGVEQAILGCGVHPPIASAAHIGDARTEAIAQEPEEAKDHIRIGTRVSHNLVGSKFGGLFQDEGQQE